MSGTLLYMSPATAAAHEGWPTPNRAELDLVDAYQSRWFRILAWFRLRRAIHRGYRATPMVPRMPLIEIHWPHFRRLAARTHDLENEVGSLRRELELMKALRKVGR